MTYRDRGEGTKPAQARFVTDFQLAMIISQTRVDTVCVDDEIIVQAYVSSESDVRDCVEEIVGEARFGPDVGEHQSLQEADLYLYGAYEYGLSPIVHEWSEVPVTRLGMCAWKDTSLEQLGLRQRMRGWVSVTQWLSGHIGWAEDLMCPMGFGDTGLPFEDGGPPSLRAFMSELVTIGDRLAADLSDHLGRRVTLARKQILELGP